VCVCACEREEEKKKELRGVSGWRARPTERGIKKNAAANKRTAATHTRPPIPSCPLSSHPCSAMMAASILTPPAPGRTRVPARHTRLPHAMRRARLATAAAAAAASPTSTTAALADWLLARGALPADGSVTLAPGPDGGPPRLVVGPKPIPAGAPALVVPESAWIAAATVASPALASPAADGAGLEPWARLALALLHARRDASDPLHAYAAALPPAAGDAPLFWSEDELAELAGTQAGDAIAGYRSFFAARHAALEDALFSRDRETFPADAYSAAHFAWAAATVRARVHPPLEGAAAAIVPGVDLAAHARAPTAGPLIVGSAAGGGGGGVLGGLLGNKASASATTGRTARLDARADLAPGAPLSIDFGPARTDGQVLLDYGALDAEAALSGAGRPGWALSLAIQADDRFADDKADILETAGVAPTPSAIPLTLTPDFGVGPAGTAAAEDALAILRLINLGGADAFLLEPVFRADVWGQHMQAPVSLDNECAACGSMAAGCAAALARLAGSESGDLEALATGVSAVTGAPLSRRGRAATVVRLGERRSLAAARDFFEARAAGADSLEFYQERRLKGLGLLDEGGRTTYDSFFEDGIA
jgi:[ribulose-bisphosphate carboxylase]/[fructose-bisphosphate aldolase]-lysine N-methyltransferase